MIFDVGQLNSMIKIITEIKAPVNIVFDLARSIDLHKDSVIGTSEKIVDGRLVGLIQFDEFVTFQGIHFGIRQTFSSKITVFDKPKFFRDEMIKGSFTSFSHDHNFESSNNGTIMTDKIEYRCPCFIIGKLLNRIILHRHLHRLLEAINNYIKMVAESGKWFKYLNHESAQQGDSSAPAR